VARVFSGTLFTQRAALPPRRDPFL